MRFPNNPGSNVRQPSQAPNSEELVCLTFSSAGRDLHLTFFLRFFSAAFLPAAVRRCLTTALVWVFRAAAPKQLSRAGGQQFG